MVTSATGFPLVILKMKNKCFLFLLHLVNPKPLLLRLTFSRVLVVVDLFHRRCLTPHPLTGSLYFWMHPLS